MTQSIAITPSALAAGQFPLHVDLESGSTITFHGSYHSSFDGSDVDAATTTWSGGAPGGASVDAGGMIDFAAGGLSLTSRDPSTHEVVAVASGNSGTACAAAHVASPCIVVRSNAQALSRLLTNAEWSRSLVGGIKADVLVPPPPPAPALVDQAKGFASSSVGIGIGIGAAVIFAAAAAHLTIRAKRRDPMYALSSILERIEAKLPKAEPILRAALAPVLVKAQKTVKERRVDARSAEGTRLKQALRHIEARLDDATAKARAESEQEATDELLLEMQGALEAAHEARAAHSAF